jgi:DNA-binding GntR family transcriptional regulator
VAAGSPAAGLTIRRAMAELRDRGLVVSVQGRGTYVTAPKR